MGNQSLSIMSKRKAEPTATSDRRSARARTVPHRFNPCGSSSTPDAFEEMAQTVAAEVASQCPIPVSADALKALQGALLPAMSAFVEAAHANSITRGKTEIEDADFDAVFEAYKKAKKQSASSAPNAAPKAAKAAPKAAPKAAKAAKAPASKKAKATKKR